MAPVAAGAAAAKAARAACPGPAVAIVPAAMQASAVAMLVAAVSNNAAEAKPDVDATAELTAAPMVLLVAATSEEVAAAAEVTAVPTVVPVAVTALDNPKLLAVAATEPTVCIVPPACSIVFFNSNTGALNARVQELIQVKFGGKFNVSSARTYDADGRTTSSSSASPPRRNC
jgi:hypothetical protein